MKKVIGVEGMSCSHCEKTIVDALESLESVKRAKASAQKAIIKITLRDDISNEEITNAIVRAGFKVTNIS
ncbi:MAG: cation transporter [Christensenellaceae bacterium]|jgi:Cu+-exporting ATPase|nr:cation transporter [Christensenellaceae bacterium]